MKQSREEREAVRKFRIANIEMFVLEKINRALERHELASLNRLSDQTLHLLSAAISEK